MGKYTIIAEIDEYLLRLLADSLVPELLADKNGIGLCAPEEHGDLTVGVYLYDIRENENLRLSGMVNSGVDIQSFPPTYLSLYYMITVWAHSDVRYRAVQEHRFLGRILQVLKDQNLWEASWFGMEDAPNIRVDYLDLTPEEKAKIWNHPSAPYRTSLFFCVGPVRLDSHKVRRVGRVTSAEIKITEQGGKHG